MFNNSGGTGIYGKEIRPLRQQKSDDSWYKRRAPQKVQKLDGHKWDRVTPIDS